MLSWEEGFATSRAPIEHSGESGRLLRVRESSSKPCWRVFNRNSLHFGGLVVLVVSIESRGTL